MSEPYLFPPPREPVRPRPPTPPPNGGIPKRGLSDLQARLLTASILVPYILFVIAWGRLWVLGTVIVVVLLAQREFYGLIEDKGAHPITGFGLAAGAALQVVAYLGNEYHVTILLTVTLLVVMIAQLGRAQITEALASISGTFFGIFYVGWLLSHAIVLREFYRVIAMRYRPEDAIAAGIAPESGAFLLTFALAVVVWSDAGAYFAGRAYGERKLAPRISPGKTVEGAIGGVLGGTISGLVFKAIFDFFWPELSALVGWGLAIFFGIVLSVAAIVGDLIESLLKRDAQVKDAGAMLPGMGGILDRIDSPLLAIPVMYYMMLFSVFVRLG
jgi:phosphatidate cytidylyltransferase